MNDIVKYLHNPNKQGVYLTTVSIDVSSLEKLFREIVRFDKENEITSRVNYRLLDRDSHRLLGSTMAQWAIEDLGNAVSHLNIYEPKEGILSSKVLRPQVLITPKQLGFIREKTYLNGAYFSDAYLEPNIALFKTMDAMSINPSFHSQKLIIDLFSVKQSGSQVFEKFIKSIPIIGEKVNIAKRGKKYSSRYCYEPYPAAVMLWTCGIVDEIVPEDILNYFDGSVRYWERKEWRISIILSAIAVESLLAEIYEEYFREIAPPDPLGALRDRIEKKQKFPPNARNDVDLVNQSRIAAVHRSSMQVGERETRNALIGATRFTHWAFSEGPLSG